MTALRTCPLCHSQVPMPAEIPVRHGINVSLYEVNKLLRFLNEIRPTGLDGIRQQLTRIMGERKSS
jgi:hypothetical protein